MGENFTNLKFIACALVTFNHVSDAESKKMPRITARFTREFIMETITDHAY